jgi:RimJ/RimL family protein N-acetyltransferase
MEIVAHGDAAAFASLALPLLEADPLRHTIAMTVVRGILLGDGAASMITLHEGADVVGALVRSPDRAALVSGVPAVHAVAVDRALAELDPAMPGVSGPLPEAEAFAAAHTARTGAGTRLVVALRLFALASLEPPVGVKGAARRADGSDIALLGRWRGEFLAETHETPASKEPQEVLAARALQRGQGCWLWELDGAPVAMAAAGAPTGGMSRIGPVYTPAEHRGHGYGAAVTAAASQWALDAGAARVVLFTDLTNPVSNRLYPRIGYRAVHDAAELAFTP